MDLREKINETTVEIFTTMVMLDVELKGDAEKESLLCDSITGFVGLAGVHKGVIAVHLPNSVALDITGSFLGMEVTEINEDVEDAIGEVANMIGGSVKSILSEGGGDIDLSLPSTVSGREYEFQSNKNADLTRLVFTTRSGDFIVELQLEK